MVLQPGAGGLGLGSLNIESLKLRQSDRERESDNANGVDLEEEIGAKVESMSTTKRRRASKAKGRSLTVDLSANGMADDVLDRVVKRQQNAMRHFKRRHSQRQSLAMSLCGDGVSLFDAVQEEEEKKESEDAVNSLNFKRNENGNESENEMEWKWKNEDGEWTKYSVSNSMLIESAWRNEVDSIEITKGGIVYEVRPRQLVECHFATNGMRQIERVQKSTANILKKEEVADDEVTMDTVPVSVLPDAVEDAFDSLSNALEDTDRDHDDLKQHEAATERVAECDQHSKLKLAAMECPVEAILHEIESLIENQEGPEVEGDHLEIEGSSSSQSIVQRHQLQTEEALSGMALPASSAMTTSTSTVTANIEDNISASMHCVHCKEQFASKEEMLMVNGSAIHSACFVCTECRHNLVDRPYLEMMGGTATSGTEMLRLCQQCVSRRFLKLSFNKQPVSVLNT